MRHCAVPVALALWLAASPAAAQPADKDSLPLTRLQRLAMGSLNVPAEIVAADRALARLARDKGLASALAATAAPDAQVLLPDAAPGQLALRVAAWLKTRPSLPPAPGWNTSQVWLSCDGSHAASQGPGYSIIWQRQPKGSYHWLLLDWRMAAQALPTNGDEWITGKVAECPPRSQPAPQPRAKAAVAAPVVRHVSGHISGQSPDGTLAWAMSLPATGTRQLSLKLWRDGELRDVPVGKF